MTELRSRYLSRPQALVQVVGAGTSVVVVPRGGGKTSNIAPFWYINRAKLMPGGASSITGSTYKQLLSRTLPPMLSSLRELGYKDGVHFMLNKRPPKFWEAQPLVKPETYDGVMSWCNGHTTYLVSQDRPGSPNSLSVQFDMIDEGRYLNKERYDEDSAPTLRGNEKLFGHLPEYLSKLIITDPPTTASARWVYNYEDYHDDELIQVIVNLYYQMQEHLVAMKGHVSHTRMEELRRSYNNLKDVYDKLRADAVLFIEGTLSDTLQILGKKAVLKMQRDMKPHKFRVSVMGQRAKNIIGTFYPDLDEEMHVYPETYNYHYLNTLDLVNGAQPDWRQDADLKPNLPLYIGSDHGNRYNGFVIGQHQGSTLKVVNNIYVTEPEINMDLVHKFHEYYKGFPSNEIVFYFDHTHISESGKALNVTFVDEVVDTLRMWGWDVKKVYLGHTPSPTDRFNLASNCLRGKAGYPRVKFNRLNTDTLRSSMSDTIAKPGRKENTIVKDKAPEKDPKISPELAAHGGDAFDTLLWGVSNPNDTQTEEITSLPPTTSSR